MSDKVKTYIFDLKLAVDVDEDDLTVEEVERLKKILAVAINWNLEDGNALDYASDELPKEFSNLRFI